MYNVDNFNSNKVSEFDIVICVGPNDSTVVEEMIINTKKNIIGYNKIYLVSYDPSINIENCITVDENIFPFNVSLINNLINSKQRSGWYLQQLIKLYSVFIIPNILDNYLVIDCDTNFIKPTYFFENNKPLYNFGNEYHQPYFEHMIKLHPTLIKYDLKKSGICHHMVFQKDKLLSLFNLVENYHNNVFWKVFLLNINNVLGSGASEYEIYYNYLQIYYQNEFKIRELKWSNNKSINDEISYYSNHWYLR